MRLLHFNVVNYGANFAIVIVLLPLGAIFLFF